jgi:hypothetical protein
MKSPEIKIVKPIRCHLWTDKPISPKDLQLLKRKVVYTDESHLIRALMECPVCGQRYYYEFLEEIDWENGNDSQYRTFIPIEEDDATIEALNQMSSMQLLGLHPRLQDDWGKDDPVKPNKIIWIGFEA